MESFQSRLTREQDPICSDYRCRGCGVKTTSQDKEGRWYCPGCFEEREIRIKAHQRRVQADMKALGLVKGRYVREPRED